MPAQTLPEKVWERHLVRSAPGEPDLLYIDLHLVHEVTSPQAFDGLRLAGRRVRRPELTVATEDHNVPTAGIDQPIADPISARQVEVLRGNAAEFGITHYPMGDPGQGIVHVIGPEQGRTLPGMTIVCGDSHTVHPRRLRGARLRHRDERGRARAGDADAPPGAPAVDGGRGRRRAPGGRDGEGPDPRRDRSDRHRWRHRARHRVPRLGHPQPLDGGPDDGVQHVDRGRRQGRDGRSRRHDVRLPRGPPPRPARAGLGRSRRRMALAAQRRRGGVGPRSPRRCARASGPQVSWGTNPGQVTSIDGSVPSPDEFADPATRESVARALEYMALDAGHGDARHRRRHRVHRLVHEQPDRGPPGRRRRARRPHGHGEAGDGRAGQPCRQGPGRGRGPRPGVHRGGGRLAGAGMLDVPGDEPRQARARRAVGEHEQPQLRGPAGPRRTHAPRVPRRRRGHRGGGPLHHPGTDSARSSNGRSR